MLHFIAEVANCYSAKGGTTSANIFTKKPELELACPLKYLSKMSIFDNEIKNF